MNVGMAAASPHVRVFVIQFSSDADPAHGRLVGRLEHVESGRSLRFTSAKEMNEFFARVLREEEEGWERGAEQEEPE
jgi:hypothetical protein